MPQKSAAVNRSYIIGNASRANVGHALPLVCTVWLMVLFWVMACVSYLSAVRFVHTFANGMSSPAVIQSTLHRLSGRPPVNPRKQGGNCRQNVYITMLSPTNRPRESIALL